MSYIKQNLDRLGLADIHVSLARVYYKHEDGVNVWDPKTGEPKFHTNDDVALEDLPPTAEVTECRRVVDSILTASVDRYYLSDALDANREHGFIDREYGMARPGLDPTYQPGWSLDVYCESELIGSIQDKVFRYTEAHSVRDFIGWVWASSLGRTKVLDVTSDDLDKAAASVVKAIHQSDGQVGYDWWAELMTTVYVRDKTVLYECYPYLNATLKVATRLIHGAEHPGFNVSW